jgi:formylglycine-generating enzyme required for sulfatase activity
MNWDEAVEFCRKLSQKEGRKYRLPTEAEWEYACRAGTKTAYSFGDDDTKLGDYGWFRANAHDVGQKYGHIVAHKKPNPWGLYDMHGNVWEWCSDWLGDYPTDAATDPNGPSTGENRVIRGGSVSFQGGDARSAERGGTKPDNESCSIGFRIVLDFSAR